MATPQHSQRKRVVEEGVTVVKVEELSHEEVEVAVNPSEEMAAVRLFEEMVKKVDEMYQAALKMENSPQLAKLLGEVGVVKVTLGECIAKLKEDEAIRVAEVELMRERDVEKMSDE